jgi:hypothetical protein
MIGLLCQTRFSDMSDMNPHQRSRSEATNTPHHDSESSGLRVPESGITSDICAVLRTEQEQYQGTSHIEGYSSEEVEIKAAWDGKVKGHPTGDLFLVERMPSGKLAIVVGDVQGKGVNGEDASVAELALACRKLISLMGVEATLGRGTAGEAVGVLEESLLPLLDERGRFLAATVVIYDPASGEGTIATAGSPRALLIGNHATQWERTVILPSGEAASESVISRLKMIGQDAAPLGLGWTQEQPRGVGEEQSFSLSVGESLIIVTDGISEAPVGDEAETDLLFDPIAESPQRFAAGDGALSLEKCTEALIAQAFEGGRRPPRDDWGYVAIARRSS